MEERVEGAEQPGRDRSDVGRESLRGQQTSTYLLELAGDGRQPGPGVPEGEARPLGQVALVGRGVAGQVAAGQLGERPVAVGGGGWLPQPVVDQHPGLVALDDRAPDGQPPQGGEQQGVDQGLAGGGHPGRVEVPAELPTAQGPFRPEGGHHRVDTPLGLHRVDAGLGQPAGVVGVEGRGGEGVQPPVVLGPDQVEGAPVEGGDHQRAVHGQGPVDIGRGHAVGAAADGQAEAPGVLGLDGQEPTDRLDGIGGRGARQKLGPAPQRGEAPGWYRPWRGHRATLRRVSGVRRRPGSAGRGLRDSCYSLTSQRDAGWSSLVARRAHNPKVGGSNPPPATKV